jgi:hypothetical protein
VSPSTISPDRHPVLQELLRIRARLLTPDAEILARAIRLCAKHDPVTSRFNPPSSRILVPPAPGSENPPWPDPPVGSEEVSIASAPTVITEGQGFPAVALAVASAELPNQKPPSDSARIAGRQLGPGSFLAGYRIEGLLGRGGMGQVYRATQMSMNREVALKVLAPRLTSKQSFRERFIREARNAGAFQHPYLISVHDVGESDGLLFFSMELVDGISVKKLIKREGRIDETRAYMICHQTLQALQYAHDKGIIHRDIKPDNLMLTRNGTVKVADLGLSRINDGGRETAPSSATRAGSMMGTPYYMPPEQGRDASSADHRSDLYALGASLYHMVCGTVPFPGGSAMEVLMRAATNELEFPTPAPSPGMQRLIRTLMAKDPADRPASAAEVLRLVEKLSGMSGTQMGMAARATAERGSRRRHPSFFFLPLALLVAAGLLGTLAWRGIHRRSALTNLKTEVGRCAKDGDFPAAFDRLHRHREAYPDHGAELDGLALRLNEEWDRWTREDAAVQADLREQFRQVHDQLFNRRLDEAERLLNALRNDARLLSPEVVRQIEDIDREIRDRRTQEGTTGLRVESWLQGALFEPANPATLGGERPVLLERIGRLTLNKHPQLPATFRLLINVRVVGRGHWWLQVGDDGPDQAHNVLIDGDTITVRQAPRDSRWQPGVARGPGGPLHQRPPADMGNLRSHLEQVWTAGTEVLRMPHGGTASCELAWLDGRCELRVFGRDRALVKTIPLVHDIHGQTPLRVGWMTVGEIHLDLRPAP